MTAAAPAIVAVPGSELRQIPLDQLIESPWNPRKHFDPAKLAEMVESLKKGQLAPIIVRPTTMRRASTTRYEIGAGHRRFRSAPGAGLTSLLAIVRELNDVAFLELLTIENKQRDDVEALDEANGFKLLMEKAGYDVAKLAARIGLSVKYVYDRLKLLQLVPEAKEYLRDGVITAGHAILLARLTPKDQKRTIGNPKQINRYGYRDGTGLFQAEYAEDDPDQPGLELKHPVKARSVRELATWINDHVRFKPEENDLPNLFPAAAVVLAAKDDDDLAPVYITYDHMLKFDAKDHKTRTYGIMSWRRADGKEKSKTCAWSRVGIVAAGRDRGDAFRVCVNRDRCQVHFPASAKRKKKRAAQGSDTSSPASDRSWIREEAARKERERKADELRARWKKAKPTFLKLLANALKAAPTGPTSAIAKVVIASCAPSHSRVAVDHLPAPRTADDVLRRAAYIAVAADIGDYWIMDNAPSALRPFGIDAAKVVEEVAPAPKAEKPAAKKPAKKKGGRK